MKQSLRKYIGKRIRLLRLKKGLTQEQVQLLKQGKHEQIMFTNLNISKQI